MRSQEIVTSKIVPRNDYESHGSASLEEPPLQTLFRNPEFEMTSEEKPENRLMKTDQSHISHHDLNLVENSTLKSKDTSKAEMYSDMKKSCFVSSVSATKIDHTVPRRLDTSRNGLFFAIFTRKIVD